MQVIFWETSHHSFQRFGERNFSRNNFVDLTKEIVVYLLANDRVVLVVRVVEDELPHELCVGRQFSGWFEPQKVEVFEQSASGLSVELHIA